ncbi:conserved hypothetical protein [Candidatus Terasakiella magnetica]|nr:conserved hypothetical protein [Candidatus Terasakiella magnetica]
MAVLDDQSHQRLLDFLLQSMDKDTARDMEAFAQAFLHNGRIWDVIAEAFPDASASSVRAVMMEAFAAWQSTRSTTH